MFYVPWLLLIVISVVTAVGAFVWALNNGQFSDQDRARFLPLRGLGEAEETACGKPRRLILAFAAIGGLALAMMAAALLIVFCHS